MRPRPAHAILGRRDTQPWRAGQLALTHALARPGPLPRRRRTLMTPEILAALEAAKRDGRPVVLATRLPAGEQRLLPDPACPAELNEAAAHALRRGRKRHRQARRHRLVPARLQPAAAAGRGRRGAYRPGAGAVRRRNAASRSPWSIRAAPSPPTSASPTSPSPPTGRTRRWTRCAPTGAPRS